MAFHSPGLAIPRLHTLLILQCCSQLPGVQLVPECAHSRLRRAGHNLEPASAQPLQSDPRLAWEPPDFRWQLLITLPSETYQCSQPEHVRALVVHDGPLLLQYQSASFRLCEISSVGGPLEKRDQRQRGGFQPTGSREGWDPGELQLLSLQGLTNQCWLDYLCWCSDPVASCITQLFEPFLFSFSSLPWVLFTPKPFFLSCLSLNLSLTDRDKEEMCPLGILALLSPTLSSIQQPRIYWPLDCMF